MAKLASTESNDKEPEDKPACSTKTLKKDRGHKASAPGCSMQSQVPGKQTGKKMGIGIDKQIDGQDGQDRQDKDHEKKKQKKPWKPNRSRFTTKRHAPEEQEEADAPPTRAAQSLDALEAPVAASPVRPGCHETPKTETDREAMMRYLVNTHPSLHDVQCNVRVECSPYTWFLHRQILQQCPYFAALFPPPRQPNEIGSVGSVGNGNVDSTESTMDVINLHGHVPGQLANVFYFMYFGTYPGAGYDASDPLVADCVLTNTAMYVAGASVGYQDMMYYAVRKIEEWSAAVLAGDTGGTGDTGDTEKRLSRTLKTVQHDDTMDYALLRLADPLRRSLCIVYEQPLDVREGLLVALRLALVRVVDAVLPYLAANAAFQAHYRNEWTRPVEASADTDNASTEIPRSNTLAEIVSMDHALFQDLGILRPPPADKHAHATEQEPKEHKKQKEQSEQKEQQQEKEMQKDTPSIAYLFHLLNRLSNIELWISHANTTQQATIATAKGGDHRGDRDGRGDAGDHRDWTPWRLCLDNAMREHNQVTRELHDCLGINSIY